MPKASEFAYKLDHPFEKRAAEAARIREKCASRLGPPAPGATSSALGRVDAQLTPDACAQVPRPHPSHL